GEVQLGIDESAVEVEDQQRHQALFSRWRSSGEVCCSQISRTRCCVSSKACFSSLGVAATSTREACITYGISFASRITCGGGAGAQARTTVIRATAII